MAAPQYADADDLSSYNMLSIIVGSGGIDHVFMFNGARFHVSITTESLKGDGDLASRFDEFMDGMDDDPDIMSDFEDWVLDAVHDFIRKVAPKTQSDQNPQKPISLLEYFSPPTFALELVNKGKLTPVQEEYDPKLHGDSSPRTAIVDTLPEGHRHPDNDSGSDCPTEGHHHHDDDSESEMSFCPSSPSGRDVILRSTLPQVPLINAPELERMEDTQSFEDEGGIPKKVRWRQNGQVFFFKPASADHGHLRELEILSQISRSGNMFDPPFRTSRLLGLVIWDNDASNQELSLMGFLLEYIEGERLSWQMEKASLEERKKWFDQIETTLSRLHDVGIVWGDVKPDNVMVDKEGNAVVVDFGGGYSPDYVEPELEGTPKGDLMGLESMRDQWLMGDS